VKQTDKQAKTEEFNKTDRKRRLVIVIVSLAIQSTPQQNVSRKRQCKQLMNFPYSSHGIFWTDQWYIIIRRRNHQWQNITLNSICNLVVNSPDVQTLFYLLTAGWARLELSAEPLTEYGKAVWKGALDNRYEESRNQLRDPRRREHSARRGGLEGGEGNRGDFIIFTTQERGDLYY
jgi:hypothetical protein